MGTPLDGARRTRSKTATACSPRPYPPRVNVLRAIAIAAVLVAALASCGGQASSHADDAASSAAGPAASTEDLFATIDAAVAKETSVRQQLGNLNPPPTVVLEQEYGDDRDQLALTVDLGPHTDPLRAYRVDGLLYLEGQDPKPTSEIDPDETALIAVMARSDVRQDFQRMARLVDDFSYVGKENILGATTRHYRLTLTLTPGANPASLPSQIKGPAPADLWVAGSGLPVRLEVKHSEPIAGIAGTGVARTDYDSWSEPLNLDPTDLEWD